MKELVLANPTAFIAVSIVLFAALLVALAYVIIGIMKNRHAEKTRPKANLAAAEAVIRTVNADGGNPEKVAGVMKTLYDVADITGMKNTVQEDAEAEITEKIKTSKVEKEDAKAVLKETTEEYEATIAEAEDAKAIGEENANRHLDACNFATERADFLKDIHTELPGIKMDTRKDEKIEL